MIRILLVRHGRTAWNARQGQGERFRGIVDVPLTEDGVAQAMVTARRLTREPLTAIYSSPLRRAADTAELIAGPHDLEVQTVPGFSSMDYGDWAGLLYDEVARRWPDLYGRWLADQFAVRVPGGESLGDLYDRALAALFEVLARHQDGDTLALVTHQAVTRSLVCAMAGLPNPGYWWIRQSLCNLSRFEYTPPARDAGGASEQPGGAPSARFVVAGLNDTCHLDPALPRSRSDGTRLLLIRHGQTAWNASAAPQASQERFRGRTDLPLDDTGRDQARAVAVRLTGESIAALYSSPLSRAVQTVEPLARSTGLPVHADERLVDIDYGRFQGLTHAEAATEFPRLYATWTTRPGQVHFPGGERLADVQSRLLSLLDELADRHPGQTIALVGHQIVNKVLTCTALGLDLDQIGRIRQDNAAIDVFQRVGDRWHTLRLNDTCRLA